MDNQPTKGGEPTCSERKTLGAGLETVEREFLSLAENLPLNIVRWDTDGRYLYINPTHERTLGRSASEVIGTVIPDSHNNVKAAIANVVATGQSALVVEQSVPDESCTIHRHNVHLLPERDGEGTIMSVLGIGHDMTDFYRTQETITAQAQEFRNLLESSPDFIIRYDRDGRIIYLNTGLVRELELAKTDEVIGKRPCEMWPDGRFAEIERAAAQAVESGAEIIVETCRPSTIGAPQFREIRIIPERDVAGQIIGTIAFGRNITERKQAETELELHRHHLEELVSSRTADLERANQALIQAKDAANAANLAKSIFLSNMSHEIRTPMSAILGMAHILRRSGLNPKQIDCLDKIKTAGDHLLEVINDILDLSKIEAGKFLLEDVPLSVNALLADIHSIMSGRAQTKGIIFQIESDTFPSNLQGDPTRLKQAVLNYVTNAIKFTMKGGVTVRAIKQEETDDGVSVRFEVEDSGIGIPSDALPRLFSPFEQADNSTTRQYGGTGLGLVITRRLAELMGGEVGVESTPGIGSTFWFTVCLTRKERRKELDSAAPVDAETLIRQHYQGRRILLVDDEPINLEVARFLLEGLGLVVDTARDGEEALSLVQEMNYAVILMDVQMPKLDGLAATRQIRSLFGYRDTPILAMTANAFAEDKTRCLEAGMDDFLIKPFDVEMLFSTLLKYLDQRSNER